MRHGLGVAILLLASGCSLTGGMSRDEVLRAPSPDNRVDAVLIETNGGATTSYGYEVHVVRKGGKPSGQSQAAYLYGAVRAPYAWGANVRWTSNDSILVEFLYAKNATVTEPSVPILSRTVGVRLASGVLDKLAEPGSMEFNRGRRLPQDPR